MTGRVESFSRSIACTICSLFWPLACGHGLAAETNTPVPRLQPGAMARATLVMDQLQAKGVANNPGADAIVFDGPPGNGGVGAKGILFKAPEYLANNTWAFRYSRSASAFPL